MFLASSYYMQDVIISLARAGNVMAVHCLRLTINSLLATTLEPAISPSR